MRRGVLLDNITHTHTPYKTGVDDVTCSPLCFLLLSQSTMVVLHALSEYLIKKPPPEDLSLNVDVRLRGRKEIRYHFDPSSAYAARSSRVSGRGAVSICLSSQGLVDLFTLFIAAY